MSKSLICLSPKGKVENATLLVLTMHWVGGNSNSFRFLSRAINDLPCAFYGMNLPVRYPNDKDSCLTNMEEVVAFFFREVVENSAQWNPRKLPILLLGHSLGGIVMYELLKFLSSKTIISEHFQVLRTIISASIPPLELTKRNRFLANNYQSGHSVQIPYHKKDESVLLAHISETGGLPAAIAPEIIALTIPILRNDYRIYETYSMKNECGPTENAENKATSELTIILPTNDHSMDAEDITVQSMRSWESYFTNGCDSIEVIENGNHFYLTDAHFQPQFIEVIRKEINKALINRYEN